MAEPATMGLGWYADPTERHERRFFDGRRWTEHVADGEVLGIDRRQPAPTPIATRPSPSSNLVRHVPRTDVFEWAFKVSMVGLFVLFLVAVALSS